MSSPGSDRARPGDRWAVAFPTLLWMLATLFLLGSLGLWNDDWFYLLRAPETGAVQSLTLPIGASDSRPAIHFWRPLYRSVVPSLQTLLWKHNQLHHLVSAAVHGLNALLLWRLLLVLGATRLAAAAGALLLLTIPTGFEVVFWLCALPTGLATALALAAMFLTATIARGRIDRRWTPLIAPIAFAAASLNEQPACLLLALPLVHRAASGHRDFSPIAIGNALLPGLIAALSLGVYAAIHLRLIPARTTVGHDSLTLPMSEWPRQTARIAGWVRERYASIDWLTSSWARAAEALAEHPARATVLAALLVLAGSLWVRFHAHHGHNTLAREHRARSDAGRHIVLLGLSCFAVSWLPILCFNYWLNSRVAYAPTVGIAMIAAAFATGCSGRRSDVAPARASRACAASALATLCTALALTLVGVQRGYQLRARQDLRETSALGALIPNPPAGAVFAPVRIAPPQGRHRDFDRYFRSAYTSEWSAPYILRQGYGRSDLWCGSADWGRCSLSNPAAESIDVLGVGSVPWSRLIPFEIDQAGSVSILTRIEIADLIIELPRGGIPARTFRLQP